MLPIRDFVGYAKTLEFDAILIVCGVDAVTWRYIGTTRKLYDRYVDCIVRDAQDLGGVVVTGGAALNGVLRYGRCVDEVGHVDEGVFDVVSQAMARWVVTVWRKQVEPISKL